MRLRSVAIFLVASAFSVSVPRAGAQTCVDPPGGIPYQPDPRAEPFEVSLPPELEDLPAADALIIFKSYLTPGPSNTTLKMKVFPWRTFQPNPAPPLPPNWGCDDRDYHLQPGELPIGSGALVGRNRVLTAGHVLRWDPDGPGPLPTIPLCDSQEYPIAVVFGYGNFTSGQWQAICASSTEEDCWVVVNKSDVYYCVGQYNGLDVPPDPPAGDWGVALLDRAVTGRTPLPIRRTEGPPATNAMTIVGHPNRIPMKIEEDVQLLSGSDYHVHGHVLAGSSGSMVVDDSNGEVIGVVVSGTDPTGIGCEPAEPDDCKRENFAVGNTVTVTPAYLAKDYIPVLP